MVFQDYALFPHLNVLRNVAFGVRGSRAQRTRRAAEMLQRVQLEDLGQRRPHELSGGQQQRVALARSLAPSPPLILLDEPFSNLDAELRRSMRAEVRRLLSETETAAILVTHDQEEALSFADRVAIMRNGRIEQSGSPEEVYCRPVNRFVATFLGGTNLLVAQGNGSSRATSPIGEIELNRKADGPITVAVRPEQLILTPEQPGHASATVLERQYCGFQQLYRVASGDTILLVRTDDRGRYRSGETVGIRLRDPGVVLSTERV